MNLKPARIAARTVAIGGVLVLGLGGTVTAAMASPVTWQLPCNISALYYAINAVRSGGSLTLADDCTYFVDESLIDNKGHLTIIGNGATLQGGGPGTDFAILGVSTGEHLTLDGVSFTRGWADEAGGAIDNSGYLTVNGGIFSDNSGGEGGAIDSGGKHSSLRIRNTVFTHNSARDGGGAIAVDSDTTITGATFSHNKAREGGAFYNAADRATVAHTSFLGNVGEYGGAIYNAGDLTLTNVTDRAGSGNTFSGNKADKGGAIYNHDSAMIGESLIMSNKAHRGGGLYNDCDGGYTLSRTTFHKNVTDNIYVQDC
jgi:predicted outer membrane repeat protein